MATTSPSIDTVPTTLRHATWRNLGLSMLAGLVLGVLQNRAYDLHVNDPLLSNIGVYVVGALLGGGVAALGLLRAHRSSRPASTPRVGIVLAAVGIVAFPVTYYLPFAFIWGTTSWLLSRDAEPGRLARAAQVLGLVALALTPIVVVLRLIGVTYQVGG